MTTILEKNNDFRSVTFESFYFTLLLTNKQDHSVLPITKIWISFRYFMKYFSRTKNKKIKFHYQANIKLFRLPILNYG